jgi:hypothetical protein
VHGLVDATQAYGSSTSELQLLGPDVFDAALRIETIPLGLADRKAQVRPQLLGTIDVVGKAVDIVCETIEFLLRGTIQQEDLASIQEIKVISVIERLVQPHPVGGKGEAAIEVTVEYHDQPIVLSAVVAEGGL